MVLAAEGEGFLFAIECTEKDEQIELAAIVLMLSLSLSLALCVLFSSMEEGTRG